MEKTEALDIVKDAIMNGTKWQYYDKAEVICDRYTKFVTGEELDKMLLQFNIRETDAEFEQRKRLTQLTLPAIIGRIMQPVNRIKTIQPLVQTVVSDEDTDLPDNVSKTLDKYHDTQSYRQFLVANITKYANIDPNAYLINSFVGEDNNVRMVPIIADCKSVINKDYDSDGTLKWILLKIITPKTKKKELNNGTFKLEQVDGEEWLFFTADYDIRFTLVTTVESGREAFVFKKSTYQIDEYLHEGDDLSAYPLGITQHETYKHLYVPFIAKAEPLLIKTIQLCSEIDLTRRMHAFPKLFEYLPKCQGMPNQICKSGYTLEGSVCGACSGTGISNFKSAQDKVTMSLPDNPERVFDLTKLQKYGELPIETLKFMMAMSAMIENQCIEAVYNKNIFEMNTSAQTATQVLIDMQSVFDALSLFTEKISTIFKHSIQNYGEHIKKKLIVNIRYPYNINLSSFENLISIIGEAKAAGVDASNLNQLNDMLANMLYSDNIAELTKIRTKEYFRPFKSKSADEVQQLIAGNEIDPIEKSLYVNFDRIFIDIDISEPLFYQSTTKSQDATLNSYAKKLIPAETVDPFKTAL